MIPLQAIAGFDYNELELLMCGLPEVDVDDWEANTEYTNFTPQANPAALCVHAPFPLLPPT